MAFEGLYQEPCLGHLVGLVRYYVHRMEIVSKEEVGRVSLRRWRVFVVLVMTMCFVAY